MFANFPDGRHNLRFTETPFFYTITDVLAARLDPDTEPVESSLLEFFKKLVLNSIDAGVGPDVQIVSPLDNPVTDLDNVPLIKNKHLVRDFDILNTILVYQLINLLEHIGRAPVTNTCATERRINTAECALVGTSQAGLERGVIIAAGKIVKTMPIVGAILFHIEQIPGLSPQLHIEVLNFIHRRIKLRQAFCHIPQPRYFSQTGLTKLQ